jgi:hypothetical protein
MFAGQGVQQQGANGAAAAASAQQLAAEQELQLAQGLAEQLGQFRDKWHNMGGIA